MRSLDHLIRTLSILLVRAGRWIVVTGRGVTTLVARLFAVAMAIGGLVLTAVALPGLSDASAAPAAFTATGHTSDIPGSAIEQNSIGLGYMGGIKENTVCPDAPQVPVHPNPPKDQITSAWAAGSDQYLFLAWQRAASQGDTAIEFELNQLGAPICNGVQTPRTAGDVLITWQFIGNSVSQGIVGYVWNGSAWGPQIALGSALVSSGISPDGKFADAVLDIDALFPQLGLASCVTYHNGFAKSRAGNGNGGTGFNSELKAVLPSIPFVATSCPPAPNVSVVKSGPASGTAGGHGTYQLVATNTGNGDASTVFVTDTLPLGETFVSSDNPGGCAVSALASPVSGTSPSVGQTISCSIASIPANGGDTTFHVTVSYASSTAGESLIDCATVVGQVTPSCATTKIPGQPNVSVVKSGPTTGLAGGEGTYHLFATNSGNGAANDVMITDTLPTGETFVSSSPANCTVGGTAVSGTSPGTAQTISCPVGTIAANGGTATVKVVVSYDAGTSGQSLTDCATVIGQASPSCATTTIPTPPDVVVIKSGPATGTAGGNGTYRLVATNSGGSAATAVTITDTLPTGETFAKPLPGVCVSGGTPVSGTSPGTGDTISCDVGTLAPNGGTASVDVTVDYGSHTAGETLVDCATLNGQPIASCVTTNIPGQPRVSVVKSGPSAGAAGGNGAYSLVATNSGTASADNVIITDTLPTGETFVSSSPVTCTVGGTAVGGTSPGASQTISCPVGTVAANGGTASVDLEVSYGSNTSGQTLIDCATVIGQAMPSCVDTRIGQQSLTGEIYLCQNGQPTTTVVPGSLSATGPQTISSTANPMSVGQVLAGNYTVTASLPAGSADQLTSACGGTATLGTPPSTATESVNVPAGGTGNAVFYASPVAQSLVGHIYLCLNGTASTIEVPDGTISASGPQTVPATSNPLSTTVDPGTYVVDATAPTGSLFVQCGTTGVNIGTPATSAENPDVTVPAGGSGVATFYVEHAVSPAASIALTVAKTNDADGSGTYAQTETASGPGQNVPFKVVVTNTSTGPVTITDISDSWPGQTAFSPVCASALNGTTLAPGADATCDFTLDGYSPAAGTSLTNTVTVTGCQQSTTNCATVPATSTVKTPAATPSVVTPTVTPSARVPASPSGLAFTGAPTRLRLLLELGMGMLSAGLFVLWVTRPRRTASEA